LGVLTGLAPLVSSRTRLLILGSFPGVASLAAQQYYGHPQNHFWKILQVIWPDGPLGTASDSYQKRSEWLLSKNIGVWDVYASCEREGSLDSRIRLPELNDFASLARLCPALQAVAHNGGESFKHAPVVARLLPPGVAFHKLPSTSPANASWSFARKLAAWREVFEKHGLV
jgi:hypoxanthine-DNA glycosylase